MRNEIHDRGDEFCDVLGLGIVQPLSQREAVV